MNKGTGTASLMAVAGALFDLSQNYWTWKTKTVRQK
jgi:hypothetical protein